MLYIKTPGKLVLCCGGTIGLLCAYAHTESSFINERKKTMNNTKDQYGVFEVSFENKTDSITLAGTLTVPTGGKTAPAVLLVPGMGPNDSDYTMMGHKLFLVLADYLTSHGIAVLRYDKRGVGQSTGTYDSTLTSEDFARDVRAGIEYLKGRADIDHAKIGLVGHSEGGMIAAMVAAQSNDIAFVVLLAAPASTSIETNITQVGAQLRADGASDAIIAADRELRTQLLTIVKQESDVKVAEAKMSDGIAKYLQSIPETQQREAEKLPFAITAANTAAVVDMLNSPWYRFFLTHDPATTLRKITMPILALNGDHDWIALSSIALPIIDKSLKTAGNKDYTLLELPNHNHWFQTCTTGALAEYGSLHETMSPDALKTIAQWIVKQTA